MSLASLCGMTVGTILRKSNTQSASGGQVSTYTTAARGLLPTTITCRVNKGSARRRFAWAEHDQQIDGNLYTITDPQCDERDMVQIVGHTGVVDNYFIQAQRNPDQGNRYYILAYTKTGRQIQ